MPRRYEIIALLVLIIAIFAPRWPVLDSFATVDESSWLMRSANFYYALGQREFQNTVYAYHPAVTTMWIGTAALLLDFPEYRGFGQGYFIKEWKFSEFLTEQGYSALQMLETSRQINAGINMILLVVIYLLLRKLIDWPVAFVAVLYLSLAPFLLGHTRILAHEGMMSLLLLASILAFLNYLWQGRQRRFLVFSAITAALAILTKSSATILLPFVALLGLLEITQKAFARKDSFASALQRERKSFIAAGVIWFAAFSITFIALWPGMWVNPGKMLYEVYGNAFSYALEGHNLEVQDFDEIAAPPAQDFGFQKFAGYLLWQTTPLTWMGLLLFLGLLAARFMPLPPNARRVMLTFFAFGLLFYLMMSVAKGRQAPRYILATFASFNLVAGLAIAASLSAIREKLSANLKFIIPTLATAVVFAVQITLVWRYAPYFFNYTNPVMEALQDGTQTPATGFGEGLELAAHKIAQFPEAKNLTVLSWYGEGPFSYFFPGKTENIYPSVGWTPSLITRLEESDYLVVYYYHQMKRNMPVKLMREINGLEPEESIWINGVEYIRIFKVSNLPEALLIPDAPDTP